MSDSTHDPTVQRRHAEDGAPTDRRPGAAAVPGDLLEGTEVGEYRVLKKIGEGGMGAVYSAIQPVIGKRVAIKVIAPHIASNPEVIRRFVDEARAVNKIGHPNIVDIFSFGWLPDQRHYFAMEFLDGSSLSDRLRDKPLGAHECRRILKQICEALEAAHRQGIVHRDLKPDNIWVVVPQHGESFAKLLDFGIAKLMGEGDAKSKTQTGTMMGTPAYMAPEQCRGEGIDPRTDVYALGCILYEMFARRTPFDGGFAELITHHLMTVPPAPSTFAAMPPALDKLILSCLEKDMGKRPQTAAELGVLLDAALPTETGLSSNPGFTSARTEIRSPPASESPDTLTPGYKSMIGKTQLPVRDRRPLYAVGALAVVGVVAVVALAVGRGNSGSTGSTPSTTSPAPVAVVPAPVKPLPAPPARGRAHVVIEGGGAEGARVLVDGKVLAEGVREARLPDIAPGAPHLLRVESAGRPPVERTFDVAAGAEVELAVKLVAPTGVAGARAGGHRREHETATSTSAPVGNEKRHRDGLVGDDIFDSPKK
ncbi:MAG: Protein kinase [Myxococcales bacterium]|nr:Protein kinase [Myxococcales bacterium]